MLCPVALSMEASQVPRNASGTVPPPADGDSDDSVGAEADGPDAVGPGVVGAVVAGAPLESSVPSPPPRIRA